MKKFILMMATGLLTSVLGDIYAQDYKPCGTTEAVNKSLAEHPEYKLLQQELEEFIAANQENIKAESAGQVYIIPVVFHVIHNYGPENISDAQVEDAVFMLNRDFRRTNSDTTATVAAFKSIAADCEIEFKLARKDPSGNCTNGIDRVVSTQTYNGSESAKLNGWPSTKYLNIWTVSAMASGAAGYSYLPGTAPPGGDGIIILHDYVGSIGTGTPTRGRALVHEVGHYLNLLHPWGGSNNPGVSCGNDFVGDTPTTMGWTSCTLSGTTCSSLDNVQNYMEYSYCSNMYTEGQKTRMRTALASSTAGRNNLWKSTNLTATGVDGSGPSLCTPIADFIATSAYACTGSAVDFKDLTWKGTPSSWAWTFQGGTPSTSSVANPSIVYSTPGVYTVTLTSTNASGSDTKIRTTYVNIRSSVATYSTAPYSDSYEGASIPNADWSVDNISGGVTWQQTTAAAYTGSRSLVINNNGQSSGNVDELISPSFKANQVSAPIASFKVAYVRRNTLSTDKLEVFCSSDCGKTWSQRYSKSDQTLETATMQTSSFVPSGQSQWRTESVFFGPFLSASNVLFKFRFTSGGGNNIFIDDFNIVSATAGVDDESGILLGGIKLFPNPSNGITTISYLTSQRGNVSVYLTDILGRSVFDVYSGNKSAGEQKFNIDVSEMGKGVYFVNVKYEGQNPVTSKLILVE